MLINISAKKVQKNCFQKLDQNPKSKQMDQNQIGNCPKRFSTLQKLVFDHESTVGSTIKKWTKSIKK